MSKIQAMFGLKEKKGNEKKRREKYKRRERKNKGKRKYVFECKGEGK